MLSIDKHYLFSQPRVTDADLCFLNNRYQRAHHFCVSFRYCCFSFSLSRSSTSSMLVVGCFNQTICLLILTEELLVHPLLDVEAVEFLGSRNIASLGCVRAIQFTVSLSEKVCRGIGILRLGLRLDTVRTDHDCPQLCIDTESHALHSPVHRTDGRYRTRRHRQRLDSSFATGGQP